MPMRSLFSARWRADGTSELTKEREKTLKKIYASCQNLTRMRQAAATDFSARVVEELRTLNMSQPQFSIAFSGYTEEDAESATQNGLDTLTFLFSANAGEPVKPLGKIISGGEMSRFMLAIKTQLSGINGISTYIFDEIDAGISGKTAKVVGEKLGTQIIAVSHLAQIACMSDSQYLIEKVETNGKTLTNVIPLTDEMKLQEIVRLLGGDVDNAFAYHHAHELVKQANDFKDGLS